MLYTTKSTMSIDRAVFRSFILSVLILLATGCSTLSRNALPIDRIDRAQPLGMTNVRASAGALSAHLQADIVDSIDQELPGYFSNEKGQRQYNALALSGGGSHGAFGAGFLIGTTEAGTRPRFKMVTGISTGALIAPFAFLGPEYDLTLKEAFTTIDSSNVMKINSLAAITGGESFANTAPLARLIEKHFDEAFIQAVMKAHKQGRRLYIGTTNLDTQKLVIWNMGLISVSGSPYAVELFQKVILASASIPAAFPPVLIEVEVDGEIYDEMHVDGGTRAQVFFHGGTLNLNAAARSAGIEYKFPIPSNLYIIRNGKLSEKPEITERKLIDISRRAISTFMKSAAEGDLYRIYAFADREDIRFHYVDMPNDLNVTKEESFDPVAMNVLFDAGYKLGLSPDPWQKTPPGLFPNDYRLIIELND